TKRSRHNANYWQGKHYLGLGPAAHSFNGNSRQWNIANNSLYITAIQQQQIPFEIEHLTQQQKINEYIMTALRTMEGINLTQLKTIGGEAAVDRILKEANRFIQEATMSLELNHLIITPKGKFYADGIAAELFQL
ncbi:MAG: oxygen-independent coproporphyrinogen III, partial [Chitinophagaceae bacterium]